MACQRARPRRRERDCDIIGHVTPPRCEPAATALAARGPTAMAEEPAGRGGGRGACGARHEPIALERELGRIFRRAADRIASARRASLRRPAAGRTVRSHSRNTADAPQLVTESLSTGRADRDAAPRCCSSPRAARRGVSVTDARNTTHCERRAGSSARTAARPHASGGAATAPGRRRSHLRIASPRGVAPRSTRARSCRPPSRIGARSQAGSSAIRHPGPIACAARYAAGRRVSPPRRRAGSAPR
jgi:hypothetical protein